MAKPHRGKTLWKYPNRARGTCPLCQRTGVKLLYPVTTATGEQLTVCKRCRARKSL